MDENNRAARRFRIEIPVFVSTVLDGQQAFIVDVSQQGVRVRGFEGAQPRMRVIMEYEGDAVCGTVRWTKPGGTMGVRLDSPLKDGPLAAVWARFQANVSAFGSANTARARGGFGKKSSS